MMAGASGCLRIQASAAFVSDSIQSLATRLTAAWRVAGSAILADQSAAWAAFSPAQISASDRLVVFSRAGDLTEEAIQLAARSGSVSAIARVPTAASCSRSAGSATWPIQAVAAEELRLIQLQAIVSSVSVWAGPGSIRCAKAAAVVGSAARASLPAVERSVCFQPVSGSWSQKA